MNTERHEKWGDDVKQARNMWAQETPCWRGAGAPPRDREGLQRHS